MIDVSTSGTKIISDNTELHKANTLFQITLTQQEACISVGKLKRK